MIIRRETLEDLAAVDAVTSAAFGRPGVDGEPVETRLLRALRDDAGWISTLSMVAERDDEIIGHVVCTRGRVRILDALGLGPISVLPIPGSISALVSSRHRSLESTLLILPGLNTSKYGH